MFQRKRILQEKKLYKRRIPKKMLKRNDHSKKIHFKNKFKNNSLSKKYFLNEQILLKQTSKRNLNWSKISSIHFNNLPL